jgi:ABC-type multidrug transport system fused ATPase/permease subunit
MHVWQSKSRSFALLAFLFLADLGCSFALLLSVHDYAWSSLVTHIGQLTDFSSDVLDLCVMSAVRLGLMVLLGFLTVHYGTPPYEMAADARKRAIREREQLRATWRKARGMAEHQDEEHGKERSAAADGKSNGAAVAAGLDDKRQPLLSVQDRSDASLVQSSGLAPAASWTTDAMNDPEAIFEASLPAIPPAETLTDPEKLVQSRRAKFIRHSLVSVLFALATAMQVYAGVKMVGFKFTAEWTEGILMAIVIVCVNAEQSLLRHIVGYLCKEEGYLYLALHPHRVYYDETAVGHWCDLCRSRIRASYRCPQCDFDCCRSCFLKRDKARGENQLRGDKGAKDEKEVSSSAYLVRALKLTKPHAPIITLAVVCLLATSAASIILPNFQGEILDAVIAGDHSAFAFDIKLYILISVGLGFFGGIKSLAFNIVGSHIANDVRNRLFRAIIVQDIVFFDGVGTGELTSRLSSDTAAMTSPMQTVLSSTLSNILLLVGGLVMCLVTSWRLTVLAMTSIYPIIIITRAYAKWSSQINKQIYAALGDASSAANQAISNIRTVRSFGSEEQEVTKYTTATNEALEKSIKDAWANGGTYALTNYLDLATSVLLLWYGGSVAMGDHAGTLTVGKLITFQLYWGMMNGAYTSLISVLNSFTRASGAAQRVLTLMDSLPDIDLNTGLKLDHVHGDIHIKDLTFAYQMRPDNKVLNGVTLHIPANTVTAIVGRSGGGKSTLVHLLMRFYDPTSGSITLDGHSYADLNFQSVHTHMAVVTQNTELFAGTIKANLVYGMADGWTMDAVHEACKAACAHEFILGFEEGYDTVRSNTQQPDMFSAV